MSYLYMAPGQAPATPGIRPRTIAWNKPNVDEGWHWAKRYALGFAMPAGGQNLAGC
jgi:hypothetical protein